MATLISTDLATTFINFTSRCHRHRHQPQTPPLSVIRTTVLPLLFKPTTISTLSLSSKTNCTIISTSNFSKTNRFRRFSVSAVATTTPQTEDSDVSSKIPPDNRIPATIITGFLGSGKTTLLNHILTADHGKRIAVIENEYGEIDIDGSLVAAKAAGTEDIIMLNNGCLCCTVRGDLVRMIGELVNKKKGKFDHIVIETTGLANPAPIIQTFYSEDQVFNDVKLDGVVTLVDAKHAGFHLDEVKPKGVVNEAVEQIAYADRIIVNKTDLVGELEIASLVKRIRNINRMAHLKRTEFGKVDLDYVLGIGGFDLERIESSVNDEGGKEDHAHHSHDHDHDHDHHHHHHDEHDHKHEHHHDDHSLDHTHDPGVSSVSIVCEGSLDLEKANIWLGTLLLECSEDIYRMKGLLSVQGMDERFVFQIGSTKPNEMTISVDQRFPLADLIKIQDPVSENKDAGESEDDDDDDNSDQTDDEDDEAESEEGSDNDEDDSDDDVEAHGDEGSDDDDDDDDDGEDDEDDGEDDEDDDDDDDDEQNQPAPKKKK